MLLLILIVELDYIEANPAKFEYISDSSVALLFCVSSFLLHHNASKYAHTPEVVFFAPLITNFPSGTNNFKNLFNSSVDNL